MGQRVGVLHRETLRDSGRRRPVLRWQTAVSAAECSPYMRTAAAISGRERGRALAMEAWSSEILSDAGRAE